MRPENRLLEPLAVPKHRVLSLFEFKAHLCCVIESYYAYTNQFRAFLTNISIFNVTASGELVVSYQNFVPNEGMCPKSASKLKITAKPGKILHGIGVTHYLLSI